MPAIYDSLTRVSAKPMYLVDALGDQITSFGGGSGSVTSTVLPTPASTSTVTSVADSGSSQSLLASSSSRKGFRMYNDSSQPCYIKYGATATTTDFTVLLLPGGYLEENHYYGAVDGIWAADASGSMRITSLA